MFCFVSSVTAEPSDAMTAGDNVTLTCSVSEVTESMRLVWINSEGKTVEEKCFKGGEPEENFLQLITQKADRDMGSWMCVLFHQNTPQHLVLYQKVSSKYSILAPCDFHQMYLTLAYYY